MKLLALARLINVDSMIIRLLGLLLAAERLLRLFQTEAAYVRLLLHKRQSNCLEETVSLRPEKYNYMKTGIMWCRMCRTMTSVETNSTIFSDRRLSPTGALPCSTAIQLCKKLALRHG